MNATFHSAALPLVAALALLTAAPATAQAPTLRGDVLGAGATRATGTAHVVRGTAGQPVVGRAVGAAHAVGGGFWYAAPEGAPPPPPLTLTVTPLDAPITIPATGGSFRYRVRVDNNTDQPVTFEGWTDATLPNGQPYPGLPPRSVTLGPGGSFGPVTLTQRVPASAPAGTYRYNVYVGDHPNVIADSASFAFTKAPPGPPPTFVVNTTADGADAVPDGVCDADTGTPGEQCTLRAALQEAERGSNVDLIHFAIPGAGVHTITVATPLPTLFQPAVIDGYSQPGASPNTNGPAQGTNAVIKIELVNGGGGAVARGLAFCFGDKTVRGLAIGGFAGDGIGIECNGTAGHVVEGCFVGTDATGTVARPNGDSGVGIHSSSGNRVGGTAPAARNLLSGNGRFGVVVTSSGTLQVAIGNVIQGNLIGTDAGGTVAIPNGTGFPGQLGGVGLTPNLGSMAGNVIGGPTPAERNVISGNVGVGFMVVGAVDFSGVRVEGNFIGTDVSGTLPLPNTGAGVNLSGSSVTLGGGAPGTGNHIAYNGGAGVSMPGSSQNTGNRVLGNAIFANDGLGIELGFPDGIPLANDSGDPDTGPNRQQNTPVLIDLALSEAAATRAEAASPGPEREARADADGAAHRAVPTARRRAVARDSLHASALVTVTYHVDTAPANATYPLRVELFRADAGGEGAAPLAADAYTLADYSGCGAPPCPKTTSFNAVGFTTADAVVATATDDAGNTSEFSAPISEGATAMASAVGVSEVPTETALHAPVPNPAAERVVVRYDVAEAGRVRLAVYDLLGREIAVLHDGDAEAGRHEATLDGSRLAAGVYLVRMAAGGFAQTRRVTLVR